MTFTRGRLIKRSKQIRLVLHLDPAAAQAIRAWMKEFPECPRVGYAAHFLLSLALLNPEACQATLRAIRAYAKAEGFKFPTDVADAWIGSKHPERNSP